MSYGLPTYLVLSPRTGAIRSMIPFLAILVTATWMSAAPTTTPATTPFHEFSKTANLPQSGKDTASWWATEPIVRPLVPPGSQNPIDAFILAKLHERGLTHSPQADRRTLIRRLTFDLHGLPPSPKEIDEFLQDTDPQAYEHLVDRLLASPRYGQRMTRLWLDVVHYGESDGFGMDRPRMNAWPYRDYIIRSFNEDKPYARFVQEQIAADAMFPDRPGLTPALGFIAAGPFNQSALSEQVRGTQCWKIALNLDRDDMVSNVAASFLSVTLHCARCHDHKFDPITQRDYYRMQSVFAGITRGNREFDDDPATTRSRKHWLEISQQFKAGATLASLATPDREALLQFEPAAEQALLAGEKQWVYPTLSAASDSATPSMVVDADGSLRFEGPLADKETYIIVAKTTLESVASLRLEVLADSPAVSGSAPDESFRLSKIRINTAPASAPEKMSRPKIRGAFADYSEKGFEIDNALGRDGKTAWGIHPKESQSHQAVVLFQKPISNKGGTLFTIRLEQADGARHGIRHFRISFSPSEPSEASIVSPDIAGFLKTPRSARPVSTQQSIEQALARLMVEQELAALPAVQKVFAVGHDLPVVRNYRLTPDTNVIHILRVGDVNKPLEEVHPGALAAVSCLPVDFPSSNGTDESATRADLAKWITDSRNPLTWRSIANRVWLWHFDHGIVDTPNDFGKMGTLPTHPQLLDWLASELRDHGGSIKHLHRLILTSATYRQSSPANESASKVDGDNRLLWRMNRHRVDAEQLRDALLAISGKLDLTMGGPPAMQFNFSDPNVNVTPRVDYDGFDPDSPSSYRRSVYRFLFRNTNDPLLEAFDASNPSLFTPKRNVTTTALQTLSLFNNKFVLRQCEHLAARLERESSDLPGRIRLAYLLLYGRPPTKDETTLLADYAVKHGLAQTCRILVNANEFLFLP